MFVHFGSFNVLAPSWASPVFYPTNSHHLLFPSEPRIERVVQYIHEHLPRADVLAFQETEFTLNRQVSALLGDKFDYFPVYHDDTYWAKWITHDRPFVRNGVAIALRRSAFDHVTLIDLPLCTGNHAAVLICRHIALDQWFRIACVHFELDDENTRNAEVVALGQFFRPGAARHHYVDVIAGDFNSDVDNDTMQDHLIGSGFIDVHRELGVALATHPEGIGDDVVDHILVRGHNVQPARALTYSGDIMQRHPERIEAHKEARITRCLEFNGSDHFAIEAVVRVASGSARARSHTS